MNGASIEKANLNGRGGGARKTRNGVFKEMDQQRDAGYVNTLPESDGQFTQTQVLEKQENSFKLETNGYPPRISVFKGHPLLRNNCSGSGKLICLPSTMEELKTIIGMNKYTLSRNRVKPTAAFGPRQDHLYKLHTINVPIFYHRPRPSWPHGDADLL
ncbi:hypothetical protein GW17_00031575 [Ensete ventricosum]|nr:hypothetical protein GW17_00031575 [Ensete ventricosum]